MDGRTRANREKGRYKKVLKPFFFLSFPLKNLIKESWTPEWERDMASQMERLLNRKENGGGGWRASGVRETNIYSEREGERERRD